MNRRIATAKATVDLLVSREKPHANVANPNAWLASVAKRIRADHWDWLISRLDQDPDLTAEQLASELADAKVTADPRPPTVRHYDERRPCPNCGCEGGGGWVRSHERDDLGMTPDVDPCPTCAPDRRRLWEKNRDPEHRHDLHASHASSVRYMREHQPELRELTPGGRHSNQGEQHSG
jgi:hypothetical protein